MCVCSLFFESEAPFSKNGNQRGGSADISDLLNPKGRVKLGSILEMKGDIGPAGSGLGRMEGKWATRNLAQSCNETP